MQAKTFDKLGGEVEIDETYIGGKARNMHKGQRKLKGTGGVGKAVVMGLLQRHGPDKHSTVRTTVIPRPRKYILHGEVLDTVKPGSQVYTDELKSYDGLDSHYAHEVINHAESYARGNVHTNGLENFWSLLKRSLSGTCVIRGVPKHEIYEKQEEQDGNKSKKRGTD